MMKPSKKDLSFSWLHTNMARGFFNQSCDLKGYQIMKTSRCWIKINHKSSSTYYLGTYTLVGPYFCFFPE